MDERFVLLSHLTNLRDTPHMLYLVESNIDNISLSVCIIYLVIQTHRDTFGGGKLVLGEAVKFFSQIVEIVH